MALLSSQAPHSFLPSMAFDCSLARYGSVPRSFFITHPWSRAPKANRGNSGNRVLCASFRSDGPFPAISALHCQSRRPSLSLCLQHGNRKLILASCNASLCLLGASSEQKKMRQKLSRVTTRSRLVNIVATTAVDVDTAPFPLFLPPQVHDLRDSAAREMAARIQRLPVQTSLTEQPVMTSCVVPKKMSVDSPPVLLLHGFDSSCLEWRYTYPLLEASNFWPWAVDILGWGFSDTEGLSSFGVAAKREHLYEFWRSYIKKPMILVGGSLGGAVAIDFCVAHPEAVEKLVLLNAQGYAEGTGKMAAFPKILAHTGVAVLKSVPLRTYANFLIYSKVKLDAIIDAMNIGRLHCFMPGWAEASIDFMLSGGYNVTSFIPLVSKETLVIWGKQDKILSKDFPEKFKEDLPNARVVYISNCGHLPHVENPEAVIALISEFSRN